MATVAQEPTAAAAPTAAAPTNHSRRQLRGFLVAAFGREVAAQVMADLRRGPRHVDADGRGAWGAIRVGTRAWVRAMAEAQQAFDAEMRKLHGPGARTASGAHYRRPDGTVRGVKRVAVAPAAAETLGTAVVDVPLRRAA